jgi:hypothetical protein
MEPACLPMFKTDRHWSPCWTRRIQSIHSNPIPLRSVLVLFSQVDYNITMLKGKDKIVPELLFLTKHHTMKAYWGSGFIAPRFLDGGEWSPSLPGRFTSRERAPGTHWIGDWVGSRAGLDTVVKRKISNPYRDSKPRLYRPQPSAILCWHQTLQVSHQIWEVLWIKRHNLK